MKISDKAFPRQRGRYAFFPCICLSGKWLRDQGFTSGAQIEIACEAGILVITEAQPEQVAATQRRSAQPKTSATH